MINPAAAPILLFLGFCDLVLVVTPDIRICVAGGALVSVLAILTILRI
jgi:hypothetical protein